MNCAEHQNLFSARSVLIIYKTSHAFVRKFSSIKSAITTVKITRKAVFNWVRVWAKEWQRTAGIASIVSSVSFAYLTWPFHLVNVRLTTFRHSPASVSYCLHVVHLLFILVDFLFLITSSFNLIFVYEIWSTLTVFNNKLSENFLHLSQQSCVLIQL